MVFKQSTKYFSEYSTHLNVPKELHGEFLDLVRKCEAHYLAKIENELTNQER